MKRMIILTGLLLLVLLAGCASAPQSFVRQDVDFSYIRTVAVFPFQNLSQDGNAGLRVQSIFLAEVLNQAGLAVVEPGTVLKAVQDLKLPMGISLSNEQVIALGDEISADAIFFGTVENYGLDRDGSSRAYYLTASFQLAETETGSTIWNAQVHNNGSSFWRKLFGGGSASMYDVTRTAVVDALGTLF